MKYLKRFESLNNFEEDILEIKDIFQEYVDEYNLVIVSSDYRSELTQQVNRGEYFIKIIEVVTTHRSRFGLDDFIRLGIQYPISCFCKASLNDDDYFTEVTSSYKILTKFKEDMSQFSERLKSMGYKVNVIIGNTGIAFTIHPNP